MRASDALAGLSDGSSEISRCLASTRIRRSRLFDRFTATRVTHAGSDSIRSPRSDRSQARARASCTASSAAALLPVINATPATSRG